ncbi:unnamed protein product, partial [Rotaria sordida]
IPIGVPLASYRCLILNDCLQCVVVSQEGELYVGGVGVFLGYLGRDDLTAKALLEVDGEIFYRTGDLVRMDNNGLLHYQGRKDHQIKLHGQRIELGEIEQCLLKTSISACVVIKWDDDHLIAYVQSSNIDVEQLRKHCQSHLPPYMIPSLFVVLDKLPLNANGKIDRKRLPAPQFSSLMNIDHTDVISLTPLEEHLKRIFSKAFHNESPNANMPFGQLGGTSLDAMRAVVLIRQEICTKFDASLLFANPSIRKLAQVIEPLLVIYEDSSVTNTTLQVQEDQDRSMPSLCVEILGIILLRLLFNPGEITNQVEKLYSWHYYRWWFLNSLWSTNNSYWLKHLLGTPFYNSYLRLCGAKIGCHTHIYTTLIDSPWLLEVGESSFIGEEVVLSSLSYQDQTYQLHRICIGSYCSINTHSVLYEDVIIEDYVYIDRYH